MKTLSYILSTLLLLILSCQPGQKSDKIEDLYTAGNTATDDNDSFIKEEIENIFLGSATPCDIPFLLEETKVAFDPTLIHSFDTPKKSTIEDYDLALHLGVFTTDFGYLASFNRHDEAMVYLKHCNDMAKELGIATAFDMQLIRDVENKVESHDALARIVKSESQNIAKYLKGDFRNEPAVLVIAGGLVEGLYISTELLARNYEETNECIPSILELIYNQQEALASTILLLETLQTAETFDSYLQNFNDLYTSLTALDIENEDLSTNDSWHNFKLTIENLRDKIVVSDEYRILPG